MITKQEWDGNTAAPAILYGKQDSDTQVSYPIMLGPNGELLVNYGNILIPLHDTQIIDITNPTSSTVTYQLAGVVVGVKTTSIVGSVTTISIA